MRIPVDEPKFFYGDLQSVLAKKILPESMMKKKMQSITFCHVREGKVRDEWRTKYLNTHKNVVAMITKPLNLGEKRWKVVRKLIYHL